MKSRLEHLSSSFLGSKVASTGILMAVTEDSWLLYFRHTPSDYLVSTVFIQEWFLPIIGSEFLQRRISCLVLSNLLVAPLWPNNLQCEHTRVPSQPGAVTLQGTHH